MNTRRIITTAAVTIAVTAAGTTAATASGNLPPNRSASYHSAPAPGTGGLILRDIRGNDLGSGIGEKQGFDFIACGPKGSGLIKVNQYTRGNGGGWGNLYTGYVKQRYTQIPSMFPC